MLGDAGDGDVSPNEAVLAAAMDVAKGACGVGDDHAEDDVGDEERAPLGTSFRRLRSYVRPALSMARRWLLLGGPRFRSVSLCVHAMSCRRQKPHVGCLRSHWAQREGDEADGASMSVKRAPMHGKLAAPPRSPPPRSPPSLALARYAP